jgi:polyhydroxyalkanoate synthase subunit PhaC
MNPNRSPRDVVFRDGRAQLYRFRRSGPAESGCLPLLLVPSMINRWYILDLRPGASLISALTDSAIDTFCLDWGAPEDEDRYFTWQDVIARLSRVVRQVRRQTGADRVGVLGYCMGGTLAGIHAALEPDQVGALVNLAGPFDFARGGSLAHMTDRRWFDPEAIAAAGNMQATQMQAGFQLLRPTLNFTRWVSFLEHAMDPAYREAFQAMESWASDNVAFPAAAYETYVRELYQDNLLVNGQHWVGGRRVDLAAIRCPVLTVVAEKDAICPPAAAEALNQCCSSEDKEVLMVPGGHVGAVAGNRSAEFLYPRLASWLRQRLASCVASN